MNARVYDSDIGRFLSADTIIQYPYSSQGYNRYSYIENNPLMAADPSGHGFWSKLKKAFKKAKRWVKKNWKTIVTIVAVVAVSIVTAGAGASLASTLGLTGTTASVAAGATTGAIAGFTGGVVGAKVNGGSWGDAFRAGIKGAGAGAIGGAVGGYYGDSWSIGRVGAQATANGIGSEITGGAFKDGFLIGGITAGAQWGYSEMTKATNALKLKSVDGDASKIKKNSYGEWDTTGGRTAGRGLYPNEVESKLASFGMKPEGQQLSSGFDDPFNRFINKVSKTHDYQNSWHYNQGTGFFQPFTNQMGAELFEVYSFIGMPVAGAYTALALGGTDLVRAYDYGEGR